MKWQQFGSVLPVASDSAVARHNGRKHREQLENIHVLTLTSSILSVWIDSATKLCTLRRRWTHSKAGIHAACCVACATYYLWRPNDVPVRQGADPKTVCIVVSKSANSCSLLRHSGRDDYSNLKHYEFCTLSTLHDIFEKVILVEVHVNQNWQTWICYQAVSFS